MADSCCSFDLVVVGGGPAGIAAAVTAAESGMHVALADDNLTLGGQIWRGEEGSSTADVSTKWYRRFQAATIEHLPGHRIVAALDDKTLLAETLHSTVELKFQKLVLATGARERFLPFPGWTLPNVLGAGGLQALVKSGLLITGCKIVVAGTGPLLLAVAAHLKESGADVLLVAEQASRGKLIAFGAGLLSQPKKVGQALALKRQLGRVSYITNCWPVTAEGGDKLETVTMTSGSRTWKIACDFLACGFHLVPNVELAVLLGCELTGGFVRVDNSQQTSIRDIYCAGEPTGIGGVELALVEGQIAGYAASAATANLEALFKERTALEKFQKKLERTFALAPALRSIATDSTLVCRCEDVSLGRLKEHNSWRSAKLHTRCGMGPCQGRVCGPAVEFLLGWKVESVRPPIYPARVESLAHMSRQASRQSLANEHTEL